MVTASDCLHSQHPQKHWNLRCGRWSSVFKLHMLKNPPIIVKKKISATCFCYYLSVCYLHLPHFPLVVLDLELWQVLYPDPIIYSSYLESTKSEYMKLHFLIFLSILIWLNYKFSFWINFMFYRREENEQTATSSTVLIFTNVPPTWDP
jgi:hypothetical protein